MTTQNIEYRITAGTVKENRMIADFIGKQVRSDAHAMTFKYDISWDWLYPVIDNIDNMIYSGEMSLEFFSTNDSKALFLSSDKVLCINVGMGISEVYNSVAKIIQKYNEQNQES